MPVEFLTEEQKSRYGQYCGEPNDIQLAQYFHLDSNDLALINKCRGDYNRLGYALQLSTVRFLGTFLPNPTQVSTGVIHFIAKQLGVADINSLSKYMLRKQTRYAHSAEIQEAYGYKEFGSAPWKFRLSRLLYSRAWISNERPSLLFDFATSWLVENKILLPGVTTLTRLVSEIRERVENQLWQRLTALPDDGQKTKLESLLQVPYGHRASYLDQYRKGPVSISGPAFNTAILRYQGLRDLHVGSLDFSRIPPVRLKGLARYASAATVYK